MVKKMYGVRTKRYKLNHVYDDIDEWELYDLEKDPSELINLINDTKYSDVKMILHKKLETLQAAYHITNKEFEQASSKSVENVFKQFKKLRGHTGTSYDPITNNDKKL